MGLFSNEGVVVSEKLSSHRAAAAAAATTATATATTTTNPTNINKPNRLYRELSFIN